MVDWLRDAKKRRKVLLLVIFVVGSISVAGLLTFFRGGSAGKILGTCVLTAVLVSLGTLSALYEQVSRAIAAFFGKYFLFCFWALVTLAPAGFFQWFSRTLVDKAHPVLQVLFLFLWGIFLVVALWLIATRRNRERLFRWLERVGMLAPFVYCFNLLLISVIFFGTVSYLLAGPEGLEFTNLAGETLNRNDLSVNKFLDFFMWHFFDAIPLLKINETLHLKEQLTYESPSVGLIVLLFKIGVIIPVIGAFGGYYKYRQLKGEGGSR